MDEKKMLEQIKKSAEGVEAPESLKPDQIEEMVQGQQQNKKKFPVYKLGAAAAVLLIALVGIWQVSHMQIKKEPAKAGDIVYTEAAQAELQGGPEETTRMPEAAQEEAAQADNPGTEATQAKEVIPRVSSEEELYLALKEMQEPAGSDMDGAVVYEAEAGVETAADSTGIATGSPQAKEESAVKTDHSRTNLQEAGVDEGDIVKTDGKYLYILTGNRISIVKADGGNLEPVGEIKLTDEKGEVQEMYLDNDRLSLVTTGSESLMEEDTSDVYYINREQYTRIYTYDISDRTQPKLSGELEQEGYYRTSRKTGDYIYLFTEYMPVIKEARETSSYLPKVGGKALPIDDIYLPECRNQTSYLVIASVNVNQPDKVIDQKAIVSAASMFYVSTENLYICNNEYSNDRNVTQILKFSYQNGKIRSVGIGEVNGYLNDSFSLNESDGYLRVVATDWKDNTTLNHLYVLDPEMKVCGSIQDLAPGENIRSARFMGDTGYFVTFRDIDPLFSVDLSDPRDPKVLGELKITGFSSYLHFYGENKLLGIGNEVDPETGEYKGIKLSMFDISNPSDVKEVDKYVIKDTYDCPALYDYKSVMIDAGKNIIGFECESSYMVFSYEKDQGFVNHFVYEFHDGDDQYEYGYQLRGLYIGDVLYLTNRKKLRAFDMKNEYNALGEPVDLQSR